MPNTGIKGFPVLSGLGKRFIDFLKKDNKKKITPER
jgi:hypothetical protein